MSLHVLLVRGIAIFGTIFFVGYFHYALHEDPTSYRIVIAVLILIPAMVGLFALQDWARWLFVAFIGLALLATVADWLTASSPFRWETLDVSELLGRLLAIHFLVLYAVAAYLLSPPVSRLLK